MRNLFLLLIVQVIIVACNRQSIELTKQEIAEQNVRQYLFKNINDTTSYQSVEFDTLRRRETIYGYVPDYMVELDTSIITEEESRADEIARKNFKPEFLGYSINHKFRSKNALGVTVINNLKFVLDTNLKVIRHREE